MAQSWPMDAWALVFESLGQLTIFKAAEAEIWVPRDDSVLRVQKKQESHDGGACHCFPDSLFLLRDLNEFSAVQPFLGLSDFQASSRF